MSANVPFLPAVKLQPLYRLWPVSDVEAIQYRSMGIAVRLVDGVPAAHLRADKPVLVEPGQGSAA